MRLPALTALALLAAPLAAPPLTAQPLTAQPLTARPLTADFEAAADSLPAGWYASYLPPGGEARLDGADPHGGRRSLLLAQPAPEEWAGARLVVPPASWAGAAALRLVGWLRTEDADGQAGLHLRIDGAAYDAFFARPEAERAGRFPPAPLAIDNMQGRGPGGSAGWARHAVTLPVPPGAARVVVGVNLEGAGRAWADDLALERVAAADLPPPAPEALAYALAALDTLRTYALRGAETDWAALRAWLPGALLGAQTPRDTYPALGVLVALVDPHSGFSTPEEAASYDGVAGAEALPPVVLPEGALLAGRFGYVAVPGFAGTAPERVAAYAEAFHALLAAQDAAGACGWVVDLRPDTGGNMSPMLAGIGPFFGPEPMGRFVRADGTEEGHWRYADGRAIASDAAEGDTVIAGVRAPTRLRHPDAPVAVLVGPHTGSSGEVTLVSFIGRPHTRLFGQPSAGFTTGNEPYALADGAALNVTTTRYADRLGRVYDGPVEPDERVPPADGGAAPADDPAVRAATAWLSAHPACTGR